MTRLAAHFDGAVASLTLTNPPVNVIDFEMIGEIRTFLDSLMAEKRLCAIVFAAEGRAFSAGVDVASHLAPTVERMIREFHSIFEQLDDLAVPTVGVVKGVCLGGACELVGYLDVVLATEDAEFAVPEITLGVFPPVAATFFPRRLGHGAAMHMLFSGGRITAQRAESIGLVTDVVPAGDMDAALGAVLTELRQKSAPALRATKRATLRARGTFRELIAPAENEYLGELMSHPDAEEGLMAFVEKRPPQWTHD
jgi:cyclohexa-1,5-dienecarbonyl-CoA hydratase